MTNTRFCERLYHVLHKHSCAFEMRQYKDDNRDCMEFTITTRKSPLTIAIRLSEFWARGGASKYDVLYGYCFATTDIDISTKEDGTYLRLVRDSYGIDRVVEFPL